MTAPARPTDPDTSWEAARRAVLGRPRIKTKVMAILIQHGPQTLEDLVDLYAAHGWFASPQGIRSRCAELVDEGLVEVVPDLYGRTGLGNRARVWRVVNTNNQEQG